MKRFLFMMMLIACSSTYGLDSKADIPDFLKQFIVDESRYYEIGKAQFDVAESFALRCFELELNQKFDELDTNDLYKADQGYIMFNKKGHVTFSQYDDDRYTRISRDIEVSFLPSRILIKPEGLKRNPDYLDLDKNTLILTKTYRPELRLHCVHTDINKINFVKEFLTEVEEIEEQKRYDKIYNACLLDKAKGMSMEVDSVRDAVESACDKVAKDPSWLDNWKYN